MASCLPRVCARVCVCLCAPEGVCVSIWHANGGENTNTGRCLWQESFHRTGATMYLHGVSGGYGTEAAFVLKYWEGWLHSAAKTSLPSCFEGGPELNHVWIVNTNELKILTLWYHGLAVNTLNWNQRDIKGPTNMSSLSALYHEWARNFQPKSEQFGLFQTRDFCILCRCPCVSHWFEVGRI